MWLNLITELFLFSVATYFVSEFCLTVANVMKTIVQITIVIINLLSLCETQSGAGEKETLRLGVLFSQKVFDFSGSIPAIEMALESIEADETLPFRFTYTHNDSMVSTNMYS